MSNIINNPRKLLLGCLLLLLANQAAAKNFAPGYYLQTDAHGELWQIKPDQSVTHLKNPAKDLQLSRLHPQSITKNKLQGIPVGLLKYYGQDSDKDGLPDSLEKALGTDSKKKDSDNDGYSDKAELLSMHDPLSRSQKKLSPDFKLIAKLGNQVLLDDDNNVWYIDSKTKRRYFIEDKNRLWLAILLLARTISTSEINLLSKPAPSVVAKKEANHCYLLYDLATAIEKKDFAAIDKLLIPSVATQAKYSIDYLAKHGKKLSDFADTYRYATLKNQSGDSESYTSTKNASLLNKEVDVIITVSKQPDGDWLISKL